MRMRIIVERILGHLSARLIGNQMDLYAELLECLRLITGSRILIDILFHVIHLIESDYFSIKLVLRIVLMSDNEHSVFHVADNTVLIKLQTRIIDDLGAFEGL